MAGYAQYAYGNGPSLVERDRMNESVERLEKAFADAKRAGMSYEAVAMIQARVWLDTEHERPSASAENKH